VDPIAAVVGFVASHSIEYFAVVNRSVAAERRHPGALSTIVSQRHGRLAFFTVYGVAVTGVFVALYRVAPDSVLLVSVLTIGAVPFFYAAFIWKLRRPDGAASLAITTVASREGPLARPA